MGSIGLTKTESLLLYDWLPPLSLIEPAPGLTFYQFPEQHWPHLRTTNMIESPFASVRLRTNAAKRFKKTKSGVCLVHQVMMRLSENWRHLKSSHLCRTVNLPAAKPSKDKTKVA